MSVQTDYGTFELLQYATYLNPQKFACMLGASVKLTFLPTKDGPASQNPIGLIQCCSIDRPGIPLQEQIEDEPLLQARILAVPDGTYIDQYSYAVDGKKISEEDAKGKDSAKAVPQTNPVYSAINLTLNDIAKTLGDNTGDNASGTIYRPDKPASPATLVDAPSRTLFYEEDELMKHQFETFAVTLVGDPTYLGSVKWGYEARRKEQRGYDVQLLPFELGSPGAPAADSSFYGAAREWNNQPLTNYATNEQVARVKVPILG
ncbi:hypothetical protein ACGFX8_27385 [Streptomyces sp. NPDC048362]|uniref:hypothetical protein n=1 Tax=Streptomyces sp. NPDC048362 TaxID=3365539 RepID=UPI00371E22FD